MPGTGQLRSEDLKGHLTAILPADTMSEAARKALLKDFIQMLKHEDGSRTGEDIEDVHDMRVATRRMRSTFGLLGAYFKSRPVGYFQRRLRRIARALGGVRDLDVMIDRLRGFEAMLDEADRPALQSVIDRLDQRRANARRQLIATLDKPGYGKFVKTFTAFLVEPDADAKAPAGGNGIPAEVRYLLPIEVYRHLAAVRAYDRALNDASNETLHLLRIEFKRLRYLVSIFEDVMGKPGKEFIEELKAVQDHLGQLNDAVVAQAYLRDLLPELDEAQRDVIERYIAALAKEEADLRASFPDVWKRFNTRKVQRQLATAVAGL